MLIYKSVIYFSIEINDLKVSYGLWVIMGEYINFLKLKCYCIVGCCKRGGCIYGWVGYILKIFIICLILY